MGCGALIEGSQVKGVVVATPFGRGVILSKILIDSTGSADIAIAAGAAFDYTGKNNRRTRCGNWKMGAGRLLQQQRLAVRRRHGYSGCLTRLCASQDQAARTIRSGQNSPDTRTPPDHRRLHHLGLRRDQPPPLPRHDLLSQKFVRHARYDHRPALHPKPSGKTAQDL